MRMESAETLPPDASVAVASAVGCVTAAVAAEDVIASGATLHRHTRRELER